MGVPQACAHAALGGALAKAPKQVEERRVDAGAGIDAPSEVNVLVRGLKLRAVGSGWERGQGTAGQLG